MNLNLKALIGCLAMFNTQRDRYGNQKPESWNMRGILTFIQSWIPGTAIPVCIIHAAVQYVDVLELGSLACSAGCVHWQDQLLGSTYVLVTQKEGVRSSECPYIPCTLQGYEEHEKLLYHQQATFYLAKKLWGLWYFLKFSLRRRPVFKTS